MVKSKIQEIIRQIVSVTDKVIQRKIDKGSELEFPAEICRELQVDCNTLNAILFFEKGYSLEIFIRLRITEKVKELLVYTELSIAEIAAVLGYRNVRTLSHHLKTHTGFSSAHYKQIRRDKLAIIQNSTGKPNQSS